MPFSFRALRHRWVIAAPKLAVIPHVAWYWRALAVIAVLTVSLVLAMWMYDAGRRIGGFDATTAEGELATLRNRVAVHRPHGGDTLVVLSVIDNLVKGASGQAVQNMNIMFGLDESLGLAQLPVLP